jgi:hypothetical protein
MKPERVSVGKRDARSVLIRGERSLDAFLETTHISHTFFFNLLAGVCWSVTFVPGGIPELFPFSPCFLFLHSCLSLRYDLHPPRRQPKLRSSRHLRKLL